jgi:hypothetical protein
MRISRLKSPAIGDVARQRLLVQRARQNESRSQLPPRETSGGTGRYALAETKRHERNYSHSADNETCSAPPGLAVEWSAVSKGSLQGVEGDLQWQNGHFEHGEEFLHKNSVHTSVHAADECRGDERENVCYRPGSNRPSSLGYKHVRFFAFAKQPIYYENSMLQWDLLVWRWIIAFVSRDNSLLDTIAKKSARRRHCRRAKTPSIDHDESQNAAL